MQKTRMRLIALESEFVALRDYANRLDTGMSRVLEESWSLCRRELGGITLASIESRVHLLAPRVPAGFAEDTDDLPAGLMWMSVFLHHDVALEISNASTRLEVKEFDLMRWALNVASDELARLSPEG